MASREKKMPTLFSQAKRAFNLHHLLDYSTKASSNFGIIRQIRASISLAIKRYHIFPSTKTLSTSYDNNTCRKRIWNTYYHTEI